MIIHRKLRVLRVARTLQQGKLVAHLTSTIAGVAASPFCPRAVQRLQQFKQRQGPFVFIADSIHTAMRYTRYLSPPLRQAMQQSWPGNTTFVLPGRPGLPRACYARGRIALRVDADAICQRLAALNGGLILSSSLNRRGGCVQTPDRQLHARWHRYISNVITGETQDNTPSAILLWRKGHFHPLR